MSELVPSNGGGELIPAGQRLDQNPAAVYLAGLSGKSRRVQAQALRIIAGILGTDDYLSVDWGSMQFQHVSAVKAKLEGAYAPATANRVLVALRCTLKAAWLLGLMDGDNYSRAINITPVKGDRLPAGRMLSKDEMERLFDSCEDSALGRRDCAILALGIGGGLRREEIIGLDLAMFDSRAGAVRVLGKGNREREVYLINGAADALLDWVEVRGNQAGPLILGITRAGTLKDKRLTGQGIYAILARRAAAAGIESFSPHDLRRTFISNWLDAGLDLGQAARQAGHKSIITTNRYDRRPDSATRKAAGKLSIPYHRRGDYRPGAK